MNKQQQNDQRCILLNCQGSVYVTERWIISFDWFGTFNCNLVPKCVWMFCFSMHKLTSYTLQYVLLGTQGQFLSNMRSS